MPRSNWNCPERRVSAGNASDTNDWLTAAALRQPAGLDWRDVEVVEAVDEEGGGGPGLRVLQVVAVGVDVGVGVLVRRGVPGGGLDGLGARAGVTCRNVLLEVGIAAGAAAVR